MYRNAERFADHLGVRFRSTGGIFFLSCDGIEYGQLHAEEDHRGLRIDLLMIYPEARDHGNGFRIFMILVELADRFECSLFMNANPLPLSGCDMGLSELDSIGFREADWNCTVMERKPTLRRYFSTDLIAA